MCDGTCDYVAEQDDPEKWNGDNPGQWFLDGDVKYGGLGIEKWRCPHPKLGETNYCVFHTEPKDLPEDVDESKEILEALDESGESPFDDGPEHRGQFVGATFGSVNLSGEKIAAKQDDVRFDHARFYGGGEDLNFAGTNFVTESQKTVSFYRTSFIGGNNGGLNFSKATFETGEDDGDVVFKGATFKTGDAGDNVDFRSATFKTGDGNGDVLFGGATFEAGDGEGDVLFKGATFETGEGKGKVFFRHATFETGDGEGDVLFKDATFETGEGDVSFPDVTFKTGDGEGDVSFQDATFETSDGNGDVNFVRAIFETGDGEGNVLFGIATFETGDGEGDVCFEAVTFETGDGEGHVFFTCATFETGDGEGDVSFGGATFETGDGKGHISFMDVTFKTGDGEGDVCFLDTTFETGDGEGGMSFVRAKFLAGDGEGDVLFGGATFEAGDGEGNGNVGFGDATFETGGDNGDLSFQDATFETDDGYVDFQDATFVTAGNNRISFQTGVQDKIQDSTITFEASEFIGPVRFENSNVDARVTLTFSGVGFHEEFVYGSEDGISYHRGCLDFSDVTFEESPNFFGDRRSTNDDNIGSLTGEVYDATFVDHVDFSDAEFLEGVDFSYLKFPDDTNFDGAELSGANFSSADLSGASFERATLNRTEFLGANLQGAHLYGALLGDARVNRKTKFWPEIPDMRYRDVISLSDNPLGSGFYRRFKTKLRRGRLPYCAEDPRYAELDIEGLPQSREPNLEKAAEVYATIEQVAIDNSLPGLASEAFLGRKDVQHREYRKEGRLSMRLRSFVPNLVARYGESPWRVLGTGALIVLVWGVAYRAFDLIERQDGGADPTLLDSIYFSSLTFTTLGYGDFRPRNTVGQVLAVSETAFGVILLAILVFVFGRRATR